MHREDVMRLTICVVLALAMLLHGCASWGTWSVNGAEVVGPEHGEALEAQARKERRARTFWTVAAVIAGLAVTAVLSSADSW